MVSAGAGIGKTRLCHELAGHAEQLGLRAVMARCWPDGGAPALWPWQQLLTPLCGPEAATALLAVDGDLFARFVAVTDQIARSSALEPICLVIDDVHAADVETLLLVRFLARCLHQLPVLLVLTVRSGGDDDDRERARLLDEIQGEATPLLLRRFDLAETTAFLQGHGLGDLDPALTRTLFDLTRGHPALLRRVAAGWPGTAESSGLHIAVEHAVARLSPGALALLRPAAVLGARPSVAETAVLTGTDPGSVLTITADAAAAGLVVAEGPDHFRFTHEIVRSTLEDGLDPATRLDIHARVAASLAVEGTDTPDGLARRAHHARVAATRSVADAQLAVDACRNAAVALTRASAFERADELVSAAMDLHEPSLLGPPAAELVLEWAQAAQRCGRSVQARARFDRAVAAARAEKEPALLAEATLGLAGHRLDELRAPDERARVHSLLRQALDGLPEGETALRGRLGARLAAESAFDGGPLQPLCDALATARRRDGRIALAEALSLAHQAMFTPDHAGARLGLADELILAASEAGDATLTLMGLAWRAVDLFHLGDDGAPRALQELRERAARLANRSVLWLVDAVDVMLCIRSGRLAEAEAMAARCYEAGQALGEVDALAYLTAQMVGIRWVQDRDGEILDRATEVAVSSSVVPSDFALSTSAAVVLARAGRHERARVALARFADGGLAALPRSGTWSMGVVAVVELAAELDDAAVAKDAYDLLLPYADRPVIASLAMLCTGSAERSLGLAALTFGQPNQAVEHFQRAVSANRRLGHRPMVAISLAGLATALRRRGAPGDAALARDALHQAIDDASSIEMQSRAAAWQKELSGWDAPRRAQSRQGVIHRDKEGCWTIGLDGAQAQVPDLVGMSYLVSLLTRPNQHVSALALAGDGCGAAAFDTSRQDLVDSTAREHYEAQARRLLTSLEEAEARDDTRRVDRIRAEIDALTDHIEASTGLGGRSRAFSDPAERARTAVRKAIKRALDRIEEAAPTIAESIRPRLETGHTCSYTPAPRAPITWITYLPQPPIHPTALATVAPG